MQTLELQDETAIQLQHLAEQTHLSTNDFIEQLIKKYITEEKPPQLLTDFAGILKDSPSFKGDPLKIQQEMRNEWD